MALIVAAPSARPVEAPSPASRCAQILMMTGRLSYRPAVDGVRAVAVMLVFVFHAVPSALPGGFIGVDVFFVLSGYLITRILVEERDAEGRIDLRRFHARRSRRLVPATVLLVVVVATVEEVWGSVLTASARLRESVATLFLHSRLLPVALAGPAVDDEP